MPSVTADLVDSLLDADFRRQALGFESSLLSLRVKPATSLLFSYRDQGGQVGWLRVLWPEGQKKARKHEQAAKAAGLQVLTRPFPDSWGNRFAAFSLQAGPLEADPKLLGHGGLDLLSLPSCRVLRYNPARRLVLAYRGEQEGPMRVVRLLTGGRVQDTALYGRLAPYLPVPDLLPADQLSGLRALAFVGDRDLSTGQGPEEAAAAGALFARLHDLDPGAFSDLPLGAGSWGSEQLLVHARLFEALDLGLAERCRALAARLPAVQGADRLLHGDASADQVLLEGSGAAGRYWLTDFDRAALGPVAVDLGSYLALSSPEAGAAFLEGYQAGGGRLPEAEQLALGLSHALALRVAEPLRKARPSWRQDVDLMLRRLEELL